MLQIFTDGSCTHNGREYAIGGIGVYFPNGEYPNISKQFSHPPISNQRAELYAIYKAVKKFIHEIDKYHEITIYTDSQYSINCLTKWCNKWDKNGWKTLNKPVKNQDIIRPIIRMIKPYSKIKFVHVGSHTNKKDYLSICNDVVDKLAVRGRDIKMSFPINNNELKCIIANSKFNIS